ncbi:uncharacterized protein LOC122508389 [Leptopilina heterotoma]|uniref:uncharacterized protein LOC122508389 n=1 Tax=Leptopilina heterotoma TaxID=63436 RepID=UPI001CA87711|nr:uncharacterized protein LOC122508389 [Leptopilina heterotoma]
MYFLKLLFFISSSAFCIKSIGAQLSKYKNLTNEDFKKLCVKNNEDLEELHQQSGYDQMYQSYRKFINNSISIKDCVDNPLPEQFLLNTTIIKKCIQGNIELDETSIQQLTYETKQKFCALMKIDSYSEELASHMEKVEVPSDSFLEQFPKECHTILQTTFENSDEFKNLGLSYTEKGLREITHLFRCLVKTIRKVSSNEETEKISQMFTEFYDIIKADVINSTM